MMENIGIYRTGNNMHNAITKLTELRKQFADVGLQYREKQFNSDLTEVFELKNLLDLAFVTAHSALNREESRGSHYREDFPERDDRNWLKHTFTWLEDNEVRIKYMPVDIVKWEPKPRIY